MANLPSTKKTAIFLAKDANVGQIMSVAALFTYLKDRETNPTIVVDKDNLSLDTLKRLLPGADIQHSLPERKFVLSIRKSNADIENVQWQQDDENLNIYISLKEGTIAGNAMNFNVMGADFDMALLPGISNLEQIGEIEDEGDDFFKEVKLFSIGSELVLDPSYDHSSSNVPNLTTLCEQTLVTFDMQNISNRVAQLLFTGILMETNNLRSQIKSSDLFLNMKKLIDKGASTLEVANIAGKLKVKKDENIN